ANTPPDAVFACELDGQLYLRTGRRAVTLPRGSGAADFPAWAARSGVSYVLLEPTADILRTRKGVGPHDAVPEEVRRSEADASPLLGLVHSDAADGMAVYRVLPR
ncbi:MAG: hypothetical protein KGL53_03755, partial [Elusimicrobia bacterium]|nr:hypothetical protein [Elusimicrobiota bacterium]